MIISAYRRGVIHYKSIRLRSGFPVWLTVLQSTGDRQRQCSHRIQHRRWLALFNRYTDQAKFPFCQVFTKSNSSCTVVGKWQNCSGRFSKRSTWKRKSITMLVLLVGNTESWWYSIFLNALERRLPAPPIPDRGECLLHCAHFEHHRNVSCSLGNLLRKDHARHLRLLLPKGQPPLFNTFKLC